MKLGIDLDGVVVDFVGACADIFGYYTTDDVKMWDDAIVLTGMKSDAFFDRCRDEFVFERANPVPGAYEGIILLLAAGHDVQFVTSRPSWAIGTTRNWLRKFLGEKEPNLHVLHNNESKSSVSCDLYLDDSPHVLTDLMDNHRRVVRYERPWNMQSKDWDFSVANWEQFVALVEDIKNRKAVAHPRSILPSAERVHSTMANPSLPLAPTMALPTMVDDIEAAYPPEYYGGGWEFTDAALAERDEQLERLLEMEEIERKFFPAETSFIEACPCSFGGECEDEYDAPAEDDAELDAFIAFCSADSDERRVVDAITGGEKGTKAQRMGLLPWDSLMKVSEHYAAGAEKYEDRNWERGYAWHLTFDALQRHLAAWWQGEDLDDEGLEHLNAVCFHALALRTFTLRGIGTDDRP